MKACILIFLTLMAVVFPRLSFAQLDATSCHPCQMPVAMTPVPDMNFTIGAGCVVQVALESGICGATGCRIIRPKRVTMMNEDCFGFCPWELSRIAIGQLITENLPDFALDTAAQSTCWLLVQPKCWRRIREIDPCGYSDNVLVRIMPCDTSDCCVNWIDVVLDRCGNEIVYDHDTTATSDLIGSGDYANQLDPSHCDTCSSYQFPVVPNPYPTECMIENRCYHTCERNFIEAYMGTRRHYNLDRRQ